jgi:DNA polymerase-4
VGKVTAQRLEKQGITTCADVRRYDIFKFVRQFGQFGEHIHKLAHGIDNRPVVSEWRRKSVSVENTYDQDLPDLAACQAKIPALIESLKKRLHNLDDDYRVQNCFLKMKFRDFSQTTVERQQTTPNIEDFAKLCEEAWQRGNIPVRLLGIGTKLIDLTDSSGQMDLFYQ